MKCFSKIILVVALSALMISCRQSTAIPTTSSPVPTVTPNPTTTPTISFTPTATIIPYPTIIPTINPTELPSLLQSAFSVKTLAGTNGHRLRRIEGWSNGFKKNYWWVDNFQGYQWMDTNHLLLFPIIGEAQSPNWRTTLDRAVVLNVETGATWLPPSDLPDPGYRVLRFLLPRWSPEAKVLIAAENIGSGNNIKEGVTTFKSDGTFVAHYDGRLTSVSPSGNKILIADDTWIDLSNGKTIKFKWDDGTYTPRWRPVWSLDENQIYFCCYFYGNAKTGESYAFSKEDSIFEGKQISQYQSIHHTHGLWLNDTYVLAQADGFYTFFSNFDLIGESFIPIFDPSARTFRNLGKIADLPAGYTSQYVTPYISPKGDYMWMSSGWAAIGTEPTGYLIDLKTLKSHSYPYGLEWSANGKYATFGVKVLSLSSKELKTLPANEICWGWHPTESICSSIFLNEKKNPILLFQDVESMSVKKIELPASHVFSGTIWSPTGSHIALLTEDGSLWQIDYPSLENFEQLTPPVSNMNIESLIWSPDDTHLSFFIGTDIYLVDTSKKQ
ncbi:MAG: hypothetical protein ACOYYU_01820 [Chloroflexota bacterium]